MAKAKKVKTKYDQLVAEISERVKKNGGSSFSKGDLTSMAHTLLNTPEQEVDVYLRSKDSNEPTVITTTPVRRYRESLKPMLKAFGIDKDEAERVMEIPFTKEHAEAMTELSVDLIKDYTGTGRKLNFPITSRDEAQMSIAQTTVKERTSDTRKIVRGDDGTYSSVPTGKTVTTMEHCSMKAGNKIPGWLKTEG